MQRNQQLITWGITGLALIALSTIFSPALAQGYRCVVEGKPVFQQLPCEGGKNLNLPKPPEPGSYESRASAAIARRVVFIGMLEKDVIRSWGRPTKVNRSVGSFGVHEQWIYSSGEIGSDQYLYMENGILRSMQLPNN